MSSNETQINESNENLDSLIQLIKDRANSISIEQVPEASKVRYESFKPKRGAKEIMIAAPESYELVFDIFKTYIFTAFSDDLKLVKEVKNKLDVQNSEDWFIDLKMVVSEINRISAMKDVVVDKCGILENIHDYVSIKISSNLVKRYGGYKNNEPLSVERLRNHKDTFNKAKKEARYIIRNKDVEDNEKVLSLAGKILNGDTKDNFEKVQSFAKGNCESDYFPKIYNDFIKTSNKIKEGEKLLIVFDLFKLIIKDKVFYTEDEYIKSNSVLTNYNAYKKKAIKNILQLK